eukprot:symbB.v1.2.012832.t2/scaffold893.1/size154614/13
MLKQLNRVTEVSRYGTAKMAPYDEQDSNDSKMSIRDVTFITIYCWFITMAGLDCIIKSLEAAADKKREQLSIASCQIKSSPVYQQPQPQDIGAMQSRSELETAVRNLRLNGPAGKAEEEDVKFLFHHFAHENASDRGPRLAPAHLRELLELLGGPLPEGFTERLYEAWAPPQGGRFKAGLKVYMQQRDTWLEQWWLALSGGTSNEAPNQRLVAEVRREHGTVDFEHFYQFCNKLAEDSHALNPPLSFLQSVWRAAQATRDTAIPESQLQQILHVQRLQPISDAAYDALLQAYSNQWHLWSISFLKETSDEEVKAAITVQRHYRSYQARKAVKGKRLQIFLGDLAGTMSNRERAAKLFLQFSGGKNHWTADDMSDFCSAIWKQDGSLAAVTSGIFTRDLFGLPPPPRAFGSDALKKLQKLAAKGVKPSEAGLVVTRDDFRRGLMLWNERRFKQLKKWEQSRYNEVYACPCCRGRFRLAKAMDDGHVFEIAKVVDAGVTPGVAALTGRTGAERRFPLPGRPVAGSAGRKLPHPNDVAMLHNQVARDVAKGAALCLLPPGSARPALAGRLLLQAAVSGSSTGAPLLLLAEEQELEAVRLWLASAAPKYEATQKEDAVIKASLQQQTPIRKVAGNQLAAILMSVLDMLKRVLQLHDVKTFHFSQHQHVTLSEACLEDFSRHVSRFPDVVRFSVDDADLDPEALPLGFTGPLQPLKRHPVIRSKQDDFSSDEEEWYKEGFYREGLLLFTGLGMQIFVVIVVFIVLLIHSVVLQVPKAEPFRSATYATRAMMIFGAFCQSIDVIAFLSGYATMDADLMKSILRRHGLFGPSDKSPLADLLRLH